VIYLNGGQIDGNVMKVSFVLVDTSKKSPRDASTGMCVTRFDFVCMCVCKCVCLY
jgi:hypothetical protein